jgi:NAD-dependent dihydropyrimidine dehydrogenase PreA subunit
VVAKINADSCAGCGSCISECPASAISVNDDAIVFVDEEECLGCGVCKDTCPHGAITVSDF